MHEVCTAPFFSGNLFITCFQSLYSYFCLIYLWKMPFTFQPFLQTVVIVWFLLFHSIMEGEQSLRRFSPEVVVRDPSARHAVSLLPHIVLFHGTSDCSIPSSARFVCLGKQSKWSKETYIWTLTLDTTHLNLGRCFSIGSFLMRWHHYELIWNFIS